MDSNTTLLCHSLRTWRILQQTQQTITIYITTSLIWNEEIIIIKTTTSEIIMMDFYI